MIMKYIKKFEYVSDEPKIGDYVKIDGDYFIDEMSDFFKIHIGKIINIIDSEFAYNVEFEDIIPDYMEWNGMEWCSKSNEMKFTRDEIIEFSSRNYWSRYKHDLEDLIMSKKYNL